ncbi:flagellar biosynthesis anti-sigma factor FlgM [Sulfurimonas sp. HSL-1716]|uniref:flagellar biosynthesis anti-sigma factor FlgM n=1 Tax=Hydrocurvibacter sulfurireducens TaxID=3131937 RepID=UPI0031F8DA75
MISQLNSAGIKTAYQNGGTEPKTNAKKTQEMNKEADMSKVDQLKESIQSGEYKINLQALSKRIADELMPN